MPDTTVPICLSTNEVPVVVEFLLRDGPNDELRFEDAAERAVPADLLCNLERHLSSASDADYPQLLTGISPRFCPISPMAATPEIFGSPIANHRLKFFLRFRPRNLRVFDTAIKRFHVALVATNAIDVVDHCTPLHAIARA